MKSEQQYSDEFLNAYLDGELDKKEAGQLIQELRHNDELSNRLRDLQKIREMVRYAYGNLDTPYDQKGGARKTMPIGIAIAASLILSLGVTLGWVLHSSSSHQPGLLDIANALQINQKGQKNAEMKLVLHVTTSDKRKLDTVLEEAESLLQEYEGGTQKVKLDILANGKGLNLLRSDTTPFAKRIAQLQKQYKNLSFKACQRAINRLKQEKGIRAKMVPEAIIVPSALGEIIRKQKEGWSYIKI
jgi:intracellular sulfur oxidation DsrE/DsrF family protein